MNQISMDISTTPQLQYKCAEECYAGPAQLLKSEQMLSPLKYSERLRRIQRLPEKDLIPNNSDLRIEEYRLGGPFLINLPVITGGLSRTSPLALIWNNGELAKDVRCIVENYNIVWYQISAFTRTCIRKVEPLVETIFILAKKQTSNKDWLGAFKDIRTLCTSLGLPNMNIEITDERGLLAVISFPVEMTEPVLVKWPILRPQIIEILGSQQWLALDLLRRGTDPLSHSNNPVTVVVTIEETSQSDWANVRDKIAKLLEDAGVGNVAVEIGRGVIFTDADQNSRLLPDNAYTLEARPGTSIGPQGSTRSAGTFGCFVKLRFPKSDNWKIMALTCHHVVLPNISVHPRAKEWEMSGISPTDQTNLRMDMPSCLDHLETTAILKEEINALDTAAHRIIKIRLQDPEDFIIPMERIRYESAETAITTKKDQLKKAEEFFRFQSERFGHLFAASGLRQQYPPATPSVSFDWALLNVDSSRLSRNYVSFHHSNLNHSDANHTNKAVISRRGPISAPKKIPILFKGNLPTPRRTPTPRHGVIHVRKIQWLYNGYISR